MGQYATNILAGRKTTLSAEAGINLRLLLINPNTSAGVTQLIATAAKLAASPGTDITAMTAERGVPYIATRAEATIGGMIVLETLARVHHQYDAAVIAAFGDPGLGGARELFSLPVIGLAEAGLLTACMLGRKFSIVTFAQALTPWFEECVEWHGLAARCGGINSLEGNFHSISDVQSEKEELLIELSTRAVERDRSDVVVLAGAPLAGLADRISHRVHVPRRLRCRSGQAGGSRLRFKAKKGHSRYLPASGREGDGWLAGRSRKLDI